ncbi:hypothetical protein EIP86_001269 [Pleurotus ostreatoroseus]|nr:hypothetical protein EIP86_001269 [Pleurotus ostreatoroseus]
MFGFLLFVKCFHWLMADRVESMDQVPYPGPPLLFHFRMNTLFLILWIVDFMMLVFAIESTLSNGVGGMVLFASEYAILMASALNSVARYCLSNLEIRRARARGGANAPAWENKSMYIFYIELVTDFLKLVVYLTFFMIVLTFYGLPLNMIRDVYLTARSFTSRLRALVRYHNATRDMDRRYPNATEEELTAMSDRTCIICREEMVASTQNQNAAGQGQAPANANTNANTGQDGPNVTPKKLPCGHIFHFQCLRSWLERQQSCPTCRRTVLETDQPNRNNAQGAARNARPGPPQPGAAPAAAQPPPNLGWLGRILGLAVPPPLVPGQFPNGQIPPQFAPPGVAAPQQMPPNAGWPAPGPQLPPGYMYPYPYQLPHQMPPQQLQPPPIYRGFYGPGGAWQPWGVDAQWLAQGQNAQGQPAPPQEVPPQTASPAQPAASHLVAQSSAPPAAQAAPAAPIPSSPSQPSTSSDPSTSAGGSASTSNEGSSTPRDAAAQAALRRLGSSTRPSVLEADGAPSPAPVAANIDPAATSSTRDNTTPPTQPIVDASAPTPPSTTTTAAPLGDAGSSAASPATTSASRNEIPSLIPLYDFSQYQRALRGQAPQTGVSQQARPAQTIPPVQGPQQAIPGVAQAFRAPYTQLSSRPSTQEARYRASAARVPISQLPPTLTDEQLARLDRLTRDAIDERLRVLEGVSGAVHRCIEELTRIRSVLPPRDQTAIATPSAAPVDGATALNSALAPGATTVSAEAESSDERQSSSSQSALSPPQSEVFTDSDLDDLVREQAAPSTAVEGPSGLSGSD